MRPVSGSLVPPASSASSIAHSARGEKEEPMQTLHEIALLIEALAALIAAMAQLVRAMRRPP